MSGRMMMKMTGQATHQLRQRRNAAVRMKLLAVVVVQRKSTRSLCSKRSR
jgi:hypothetical protein